MGVRPWEDHRRGLTSQTVKKGESKSGVGEAATLDANSFLKSLGGVVLYGCQLDTKLRLASRLR